MVVDFHSDFVKDVCIDSIEIAANSVPMRGVCFQPKLARNRAIMRFEPRTHWNIPGHLAHSEIDNLSHNGASARLAPLTALSKVSGDIGAPKLNECIAWRCAPIAHIYPSLLHFTELCNVLPHVAREPLLVRQ